MGGTVTAARNIMSGNGNGDIPHGDRRAAGLLVVASNFTVIRGNYFGLSVTGSTAIGNSDGIRISGANNEVGGDGFGAGNTASGNRHSIPYSGNPLWCGGRGISEDSVIDEITGEFLTRDNNYKGNRIGTNAAGNAAVGNCSTGFFTSPRNTAVVGSITPMGRNTVSGNTNGGLFCSIFVPFEIAPTLSGRKLAVGPTVPEGFCRIVGNNVGTDTSGNIAIPNNHDVFQLPNFGAMIFLNVWGGIGVYNTETLSDVGGSSGTSSGSCTGFCNLVAGTGGTNTQALLYDELPGINRAGRMGEVGIFKNYIGTNFDGTAALPNKQGVRLWVAAATSVNQNLISGNTALNPQNGFGIRGGVSNISLVLHIIRGNLIGTDRTGINALPNDNGILLGGNSGAAIIGGTNDASRNIISGNTGTGIILADVPSVPTVNNYIGANIDGDPLGNGGNGVELRGDFDYFGDNSVGNVIANNGQTGVLIIRGDGSSTSNRLRFNSIYNNGALGIDLSADDTLPYEADGVTENDCDDADLGSNGLQNFPILTTPIFNGGGTVTVGGALGSAPSQTYTLDFYSNSTVDPSNYGEGETYIGSKSVTTGDSGKISFQFTSTAQVAEGVQITATATDADGNTSEFSCYAGQCVVRLAGLTELESVMEALAPGCEIGFVVNINTDEPDPVPADGICDVNLGTAGEQCSLRAAIQTTNAVSGSDFISFDIPGGGVQSISPTSDLPPITENVYINATTQPGYSGTPLVEVNGSGTPITSNGLVFAAGSDGSNVIALTINRFGDSGILIEANEVEVSKSYIGVFADGIGVDPTGRQRRGIMITGARNKIGGILDAAEPSIIANNVIAGNSVEEIKIIGSAAIDNTLVGNSIGFTLANEARNRLDESFGIFLATGSSRTTVGGVEILSQNIIQGNTGIWILESDDNVVRNNSIANSSVGVAINRGKNNTIGGVVLSEDGYTDRNLIINNVWGVYLSDQPYAPQQNCDTEFRSISGPMVSSAAGIVETTGNKLLGNQIGIRKNDDPINDFKSCVGVVIDKASGNFVGSSEQGFINVISGNKYEGIMILKDGTGNEIYGNLIGTKRTGLEAYPNFAGVTIAGNQNKVINNLISGNSGVGVQIGKRVDSDPVPDGNVVMTNKIGLGVNDTLVPNLVGIEVQGTGTIISGNTISGNTDNGLLVQNDLNSISNNFIGTDPSGSGCRPNTEIGIFIFSSNNNVSGNVISCNKGGVVISRDQMNPGMLASSNTLTGNFIGTNATGTTALQGQEVGVALLNGASNNLIGGITGGARNIISGNTVAGIEIQPGLMGGATPPTTNKIQGNYIGTNADGTGAIPNQIVGVDVDGASQNLVGGFGADMPGARNIISGNGGIGIRLIRGALATRISGNFIGTQIDGASPLGNIGDGIQIGVSTTGTIIGGPEANAGNTIAFNGQNGIVATSDAGNNNIIDPNSIFGNSLLGIDLGGDGHTPNDPGDADTGPNNLQNYPEIVSKQIVENELTIGFKLDSDPINSDYGMTGIYIEFFKADITGEGERFIGSTYYSLADYNSLAPGVKTVNLGNIMTLGITPTDPITATATDANGNTSEFTPPLTPTAAAVSISGRILTNLGTGLWNAVVTLIDQTGNARQARSNTFGYFNFEGLEAGQIIIIEVRSKESQFEPRVISVFGDISDLEISPGVK